MEPEWKFMCLCAIVYKVISKEHSYTDIKLVV